MSHFAQVENGIVVNVIVAEQDFIDGGHVGDPSSWIKTSYNTRSNAHIAGGTPLRGNFAAVGYIYDSANDVFYPPQPDPAATLDAATWTWVMP